MHIIEVRVPTLVAARGATRPPTKGRLPVALIALALATAACGSNASRGGGYVVYRYADVALEPCRDPVADGAAHDGVALDGAQATADGTSGATDAAANDGSAADAAVVVDGGAPQDTAMAVDTGGIDTGASLDGGAANDIAGDTSGDTLGDSGGEPDPDTMAADTVAADTMAADTVAADTVSGPPTFTTVYNEVLLKYGCTSTYCHGAKAGGLDYFTDPKLAYGLLVNKASKIKACQFLPLVLPGKPESSVLYTKVKAGVATCGEKMPVGSQGLPEAAAKLVHDWIKAGAPQ